MPGKYPTPKGPAATAAKRRYNDRHYETIHLSVPKGQKDAIKAAAERKGQSVNQFIQDAVAAWMGRSELPDQRGSGTNDKI